jgi:hypothetical protein
VALFAELEREGFFAGEPDAPLAIRLHREAVERGTEDREWEWASEILARVKRGQPSVTEAEFTELHAWFIRFDVGAEEDTPLRARLMDPMASRHFGATETVMQLRALREAHPRVR